MHPVHRVMLVALLALALVNLALGNLAVGFSCLAMAAAIWSFARRGGGRP